MLAGEEIKMGIAERLPSLTPDEVEAEIKVILDQLHGGESKMIRQFVLIGMDALMSSQGTSIRKPSDTGLFAVAKILSEENSISEIYRRIIEEVMPYGLEAYYPFIRELTFKGIQWKPEKVFELPAPDSDLPPVSKLSYRTLHEVLANFEKLFKERVETWSDQEIPYGDAIAVGDQAWDIHIVASRLPKKRG